MVNRIYIMVRCPKIECPRSILYCYECDNMKDINDEILTCDWDDKNKLIK
jgi:hypothetical protein